MHIKIISQSLGLRENQVRVTIGLLQEGGTVPFISRYRKEQTGSLDEVEIEAIKNLLAKLEEVDLRKHAILKSIEEQGKLSDELRKKIQNCYVLQELEDIYLPFKPKRRTRAGIAREKGLEPLADLILKQEAGDVDNWAQKYLNDKVKNTEEALAGARDIIAEQVSETIEVRNAVRKIFEKESIFSSKVVKGKEEEGAKYADYFTYSEPLRTCPSHRFLAVMRAANEGVIKISAVPDPDRAVNSVLPMVVRGRAAASNQVDMAVRDAYKRLIEPSLENELLTNCKAKADEGAIKIFAENLRQLLLASPLGEKNVLALDPGFRSGCKLVCLDSQANLVHNENIYPHAPQKEINLSSRKLTALVDAYKIDAIAIGNGTASRETEQFVKNLQFNRTVQVFVVSEDGASIYSASPVAREEFPDFDVTVRGAVSIGRRLMDPLSELVKIDPKSIGVGQYQHDVDQSRLKDGLSTVVVSCVNKVGVNVNTASKYLLSYVSGLGPQLAQNIIAYRNEKGAFSSREQLKKVPRLGPKAYEQCAGFLRIVDGSEALDNSGVHPESYHLVQSMAKDLSCTAKELIGNESLIKKIDIQRYTKADFGVTSVKELLQELVKPKSDPRSMAEVFEFASGITTIDDLKVGMEVPGIVSNITAFGAFVDVGVKQDGLIHISQMSNTFVSDPNTILKLHQHVKVRVLEVDVARKRIALSMKL